MSAKGPHHIHLAARGHYDATLTFDGEEFPYDVYSVRYELTPLDVPKVTLEFRPDNLTIEHTPPAITFDDTEWNAYITAAFEAAELGEYKVIDAPHGGSTIRLVVFPNKPTDPSAA